MLNSATFHVTTPTDREILVTRDFNAPIALVWDAMTKPELLNRWLFGPPGWAMTVCDDDARSGGKFRWAWRGPNAEDMAMHGVYREVIPPTHNSPTARLVRTESFEFGCTAQSGEQLVTLTLTERAGITSLRLTILSPSREARDATIASGMEYGIAAGYDRLEEILPTLA